MKTRCCRTTLVMLALSASLFAQTGSPTPTPDPSAETIARVDTNLIQTGIQIYRKNGDLVLGLGQDELVLRIDGRVIPIRFFQEVIGSAVGPDGGDGGQRPTAAGKRIEARTIVFVVDDIHLSPGSLTRTRRTLQKFVSEQMLPSDRIAIVSSGGKVGFLQQFTSDRPVLRAALDRLTLGGSSSDDHRDPKMDEFSAQMIVRGDRDITNQFVSRTAAIERIDRPLAENIVQSRARTVMGRTQIMTATSLSALESTIRAGSVIPGRKLIHFISDGFLLDPGNTDATDRLNDLINSAARSNTVINSYDARGLEGDTIDGATGQMMSYQVQGRFELQDALSSVAVNTGGRFVRNTNDLAGPLIKTTAEAFQYYLVAWDAEDDAPAAGKLRRIEISVKERPDLKTRVHRGYIAGKRLPEVPTAKKVSLPQAPAARANPATLPEPPPAEVRVPTQVRAAYFETAESGPAVSAFAQVGVGGAKAGGSAVLEITYEILDSNGKQVSSEKFPLTLKLPDNLDERALLQFNHEYQSTIRPGLYQVRVTAVDQKGHKGSAFDWIEVPDVGQRRIALSSISIGDRGSSGKLERSVTGRFASGSTLRYAVFAYASQDGSGKIPDLALDVSVRRSGQVISTFTSKLELNGQNSTLRSLPYLGEMPLKGLLPGYYELAIVLKDGSGKHTAERRVPFEVE